MNKKAEKEKYRVEYRVSIKESADQENDGYLEELVEKSKKKGYGPVVITCNPWPEIILEGEDTPVLKLIAWLSRGPRKERLRRAEMISEEISPGA